MCLCLYLCVCVCVYVFAFVCVSVCVRAYIVWVLGGVTCNKDEHWPVFLLLLSLPVLIAGSSVTALISSSWQCVNVFDML